MSTTDGRTVEDRARARCQGSILQYQQLVRQMPVSSHVAGYAARLTRATRPGAPEAPGEMARWLRWGAGPRAGSAS
jgi:MoxR-like ATPase